MGLYAANWNGIGNATSSGTSRIRFGAPDDGSASAFVAAIQAVLSAQLH